MNFTQGNKIEAVDIMREAAEWLIDTGRPMWGLDEITAENLKNGEDEFHVMWENGINAVEKSIAAMIICFEDKFIWPDIEAGTSGFIHKLAVRRDFAGKGYASKMVEYAKEYCAGIGIKSLRLDCDPHREGLMNFYYSCGFALKEIKNINTQKLGNIDVALFEYMI
ncbi:MAG: GNAT family N-acetyltransferase [Oscillospiraceae bacterium]|nr:GNAT family N-acetyltransferase [Oscillospiraceae bacterium]